MNVIMAIIKDLISKKFWGTFEIKFENGKPVHYFKKESGKITE